MDVMDRGALKVSVPYEITLLSNKYRTYYTKKQFQYLMKLHYSQTIMVIIKPKRMFQYLMKLHYSQTSRRVCKEQMSFSTL